VFCNEEVQVSGFRVKQRTAEQQNIEPQNFEGWNRCALSFKSIKIDRMASLDIHYSILVRLRRIRFFSLNETPLAEVAFSIKLSASAASSDAEPRTFKPLNPEPLNPEPLNLFI
jgi:hypothetical protein